MNEQTSQARLALAGATATPIPSVHGISRLTPEAETAAAALSQHSMSRVIISGVVRLCEFAFVAAVGLIVDLLYVPLQDARTWPYAIAILGTAAIYITLMLSTAEQNPAIGRRKSRPLWRSE